MQSKIYNAYRITHKNGNVEDINALDLVQALENMDTAETESKVLQAFLVKENVRTLVDDEPAEITFTAVVADGATGSIATPSSGTIHAGDQITLEAIPAKNYEFVSWKMNGDVISEDASLLYTMPDLGAGLSSVVFTATFKLQDVKWTTKVSPEGAGTVGCIAFPVSGTTKANENASFLAAAEDKYTFDHWERNGVNIGTDKLLTLSVSPLAETETECIYTAVFTE